MDSSFVIGGILQSSFDVAMNACGAKKLEKLKKRINNEKELVEFCLKLSCTAATNHVLHYALAEASNLSKVSFTGSAADNVPVKVQDTNDQPKGQGKKVGNGVGYASGADNKNLHKVMSERMVAKTELVLKCLQTLKWVDSFLTIFETNFAAKADASTYSCIHQSGLKQLLVWIMEDHSISEISARAVAWEVIVDICLKLSRNPNLLPILNPTVLPITPKYWKFQLSLDDVLVTVMRQFESLDESEELEVPVQTLVAKLKASKLEFQSNIQTSLKVIRGTKFDDGEFKYEEDEIIRKTQESPADAEFEKNILQFLRERQFSTVDLSSEPFKFAAEVSSSANAPLNKKRLLRIKQELAILTNSLPDGIFVRVNEDRPDIIKVLIAGPADTPYENGLFIFDLFLTPEFPQKPPKMKMVTTGDSYRFNPNLYQDGYVCLSLLGTWQGPGWDPNTSTLLQLLISLQAMVMCEEPYCNEPGWYNDRGSDNSKHYTKQVRRATLLYALAWHMSGQTPMPSYFKDVMEGYLCLKKEQILKTLNVWEEDARTLIGDKYAYGAEAMRVNVPNEKVKETISDYLLKLTFPLN